jgi:thiamine-phosphate pyrophosphorylase
VSRHFSLHLVTEPRRTPEELRAAIQQAIDGGVDWVQLRDKSGSAAAVYQQAEHLRRATRAGGARLSINDRLDVALAVEADGVHLAGQSLPVGPAARLADGRLLVGRSVHGLEEAVACVAAGADYLTFGHVFPTQSHPGLPPHGLDELAQVVAAVDVPVLAIGGIGTHNFDAVLATGCAGIAVISAVLSAAEPRSAAAQLRDALDSSPHRPRIPFGEPIHHAGHRQPAGV